MKGFWLPILFLLVGLVLILSGFVSVFTESFQLVVKKAFLLGFWYVVTYLMRRARVGKIAWEEMAPEFKAVYYFVLLLGSAMIVAWG